MKFCFIRDYKEYQSTLSSYEHEHTHNCLVPLFTFLLTHRIYPRDWFWVRTLWLFICLCPWCLQSGFLSPLTLSPVGTVLMDARPDSFFVVSCIQSFLEPEKTKSSHATTMKLPHAHKSNSFVSRDTFHGLTWGGDTILSWQCICLLFLGDFLLSGLKGPS